VYKAEVITCTVDIGQPKEDLRFIKEKALKLGAKKAYVLDLKKEFARDFIAKEIRANGLYQHAYPLSTALSRYIMVEHAVAVAAREHADAIAHGSTGKGNSQLRFDISITTLNPTLKVIAPIREWGITRDKEIAYAKLYHIPVPVSSESVYSTDENIWGRGIASGVLEDPSKEPPDDILGWVTSPEKSPNKPEYCTLSFQHGIPVALNGEKMELDDLIVKLNVLAGKHGVGLVDHVEDRIIGLKSRDFYECPAAVTILLAHRDLEKYTCTQHENNFKNSIDAQWAYVTYAGLWYDPLMDALNAFIDTVNKKVTGTVRLKLYKGSVRVVGRDSPYALYSKKMTTYMTGQTFNHGSSAGFIELFGLQTRMSYQHKK
jgi:argininosuccinate synthase